MKIARVEVATMLEFEIPDDADEAAAELMALEMLPPQCNGWTACCAEIYEEEDE